MREGIHPTYRRVVFEDPASGHRWVTRSTVATDRTTTWEDGSDLPHVIVDVSMYSHPFFTGTQRVVDTAGRVERFERRYGSRRRR